jgi:hypothetical protein
VRGPRPWISACPLRRLWARSTRRVGFGIGYRHHSHPSSAIPELPRHSDAWGPDGAFGLAEASHVA